MKYFTLTNYPHVVDLLSTQITQKIPIRMMRTKYDCLMKVNRNHHHHFQLSNKIFAFFHKQVLNEIEEFLVNISKREIIEKRSMLHYTWFW